MVDVAEWVSTHKPQAAIIGGVGGALVLIVASRVLGGKKSPSTAQGPGEYLTPNMLTSTGADGSVITIRGPQGYDFAPPQYPETGYGWGTYPAPSETYPAPAVVYPTEPSQPTQPTAPPAPSYAPAAMTQATVINGTAFDPTRNIFAVSNPVGSADAAAGPYYQPSASDYLSETRPIVRTVAQGGYTVDNTRLGSGSVVPVGARIAGERYDSTGRVIY